MLILCLRAERLIELLREFPSEEPTRKRFIQEMINWSGRFGPLERGDSELHHAAGSVFAEGMPCYVARENRSYALTERKITNHTMRKSTSPSERRHQPRLWPSSNMNGIPTTNHIRLLFMYRALSSHISWLETSAMPIKPSWSSHRDSRRIRPSVAKPSAAQAPMCACFLRCRC